MQKPLEHHYTFRKTHHGPVITKEDATHALTVKIARIFDGTRIRQALAMTKAKNFAEWKAGISMLYLPMFNTAYADADGTIFYVYNAAIPIRDPQFRLDPTGRRQRSADRMEGICTRSTTCRRCSIRPAATFRTAIRPRFMTADDGNPAASDFPQYMVEDKYRDRRRSQISRKLLREAHDRDF